MRFVRIAVDIMSGDRGPEEILNGTLEARNILKNSFFAYLCGDEEYIRCYLKDKGIKEKEWEHFFCIKDCKEKITPKDTPSTVWKTKTDASVIKIITLQKQGIVDASISAGDTGILMSASLFILGRTKNAVRPALAAFLPTTKKKPVLLLDVGANINCRVEHLVSFALMGYNYVKKYFSLNNPILKLLNIGLEPNKGTKILKEADYKLKKCCSGYSGYIEGSGVFKGEADVVVCDGFTGNILLKASESFHVLLDNLLPKSVKNKKEVKNVLNGVLNPENYGAVPFLGIKGIVLKAHGSSSSKAFANAIVCTINILRKKIL